MDNYLQFQPLTVSSIHLYRFCSWYFLSKAISIPARIANLRLMQVAKRVVEEHSNSITSAKYVLLSMQGVYIRIPTEFNSIFAMAPTSTFNPPNKCFNNVQFDKCEISIASVLSTLMKNLFMTCII